MRRLSMVLTAAMVTAMLFAMPACAQEITIESGIYVNDMNLSGMTAQEAKDEIEAYVESFKDTEITLHAIEGGTIVTTAADLGLKWGNEEILEEACSFGRDGDILQCYKELKDLEYKNKVYRVKFDFETHPKKAWCIDGEKLDRATKTYEFTTINDFEIMMPNKNVKRLFIKKTNLIDD